MNDRMSNIYLLIAIPVGIGAFFVEADRQPLMAMLSAGAVLCAICSRVFWND